MASNFAAIGIAVADKARTLEFCRLPGLGFAKPDATVAEPDGIRVDLFACA